MIHLSPFSWGFRTQPYMNTCHLYPSLNSVIKSEKPDIVDIIEEPYSLVTAQTLFHCLCQKKPPATVFFSAQNLQKQYPLPFRWTEQYVFKNATGSHPISEEVLDVMRNKGFSGPSTLIPLGVNINTYNPNNKTDAITILKNDFSLSQKDNIPIVLFIGRLVEEKGYDDLIDASFQSLEKFSLGIVGGGPDKNRIVKRLKELKTIRPTFYTGRIPHSKAATILAAADIIVVPSRTTKWWKEQFGRVIVEGQCSGAAVIGSDSGEIPKVIGDTGLIFPEGDVSALQEQIELLLSKPNLLTKFKEKGLNHSRKNYGWKAIAARTVKSYKELINTHKVSKQF